MHLLRRTLPLFLALFISTALIASDLELILTVPVETKLGVKGVPGTLETWVKMIQAAKGKGDTIDIEQFYLSTEDKEPMEDVLDALRGAAKNGVAVRLLVDKTFLKNESGGKTELADTDNIEIRLIDYSKRGGGVQHSKFFVVNKTDAYLGSANFDWRALKHIHETGVRTNDEHVITSLQTVFERDWAEGEETGSFQFPASRADAPKIVAAKEIAFAASPVKDLPTGMTSTIDDILALIKDAKTSVQLQTMDYSTGVFGRRGKNWDDLQNALIKAAKTVKVQLLIDKSKAGQPGIAQLAKAGVEVKAVHIPEYSGGPIKFARLIHSKYVIVDGTKYWLGTDNFSKGYFYESRGVGIVTSDKKTSAQLGEVFQNLWLSAYARPIK
jgi:phosphatidylserine/phosphatidylglycerophosphate/cardiolipin synthase-like enzyme